MDFKSIALSMYPYWIFGAFMVWATVKAGFGKVVRVEKEAVWSFVKFLAFVTLFRAFLAHFFPDYFANGAQAVSIIPWQATLFVFWEDACNGLPLLLLRKFLGTRWWTWPIHFLLMLAVMVEFGSGHVYQGLIAAMFLSLYIPYSVRLGDKYGFGTVMVCHTLYDLVTLLSLKLLL